MPSQVVTEYVRYRLPIKIGRPIEGLTYDSARRVGGKGVVLFFAHEGINSDDAFGPLVTFPLRIVDELTVTVPVAE